MKIAVISFTGAGKELAGRMAKKLTENGHYCQATAWEKGMSLSEWTKMQFSQQEALIFIGAAGIAVRASAPFLKDKMEDPAVMAVDEKGRFVIPLLSGHVGGGNRLALEIAAITGGQAAITTATDVNGLFAVDVFAAEHGMVLSDRELAKQVSASLLEGERPGWICDWGDFPAPKGFRPGNGEKLTVWITLSDLDQQNCLKLIPRAAVLGIGCRRGTPKEALEQAVAAALNKYRISPLAVGTVATIDRKKDEPGLREMAVEHGWPIVCYTAEELERAEGDFTESPFVRKTVGTGNVCQRAAVLAGGELIGGRMVFSGITVAVSLRRNT